MKLKQAGFFFFSAGLREARGAKERNHFKSQ